MTMKYWLAVMVVAGGWMASPERTSAQAERKPLELVEIMKKTHKGKESIQGQVRTEYDAAEPKYDRLTKLAKEWLTMAEDLAATPKPRKGEDASWKEKTAAYLKMTKELVDATEKKDLPAITKAHRGLTSTCMACHLAHR